MALRQKAAQANTIRRTMLGKAMRRRRVKNSASNHAVTATAIHIPSGPLDDRAKIADRAKEHGKSDRDEDVAEAADEAKLFVVRRGGQFRRLAGIFQRAQAFGLFAVIIPRSTPFAKISLAIIDTGLWS